MAQTPRRSGAPLNAIGASGLSESLGIVWEEPEIELRGTQGARTYARIAREPILSACLHAIDSVVRGIEWTVEPAKPESDDPANEPTPEAQQEAEWVEDMLLKSPGLAWIDFVSEALSFQEFGYALFEVIYEIGDDGRFRMVEFSPRPQETIQKWVFDKGRPIGAVQRLADGKEVTIPLEKCLHFVLKQRKGNPEGRSMLRSAHRPWKRKERLQIISDIGTERDLTGVPVMYIPAQILINAQKPNASAQEKAILDVYYKMVRDLRINQQAGIVLPSDPHRDPTGNAIGGGRAYELQLLASNSTRNVDIEPKLDRCELEMARLFLADFLLLGKGAGTGSYAMSADKTSLFTKSLNAVLLLIQGVINGKALPRLWALNGLNPDVMPTVKAGELTQADTAALSATIASLAGAGAEFFPDDTLENNLRRKLELPPKPPGGIERPEPEDPTGDVT